MLIPGVSRFEIVALFFNLDIDVMQWSQYLSFALVGVLVVSSTRSLLINLTKLFHFFASAGSSHLVLLFMSQVMRPALTLEKNVVSTLINDGSQ